MKNYLLTVLGVFMVLGMAILALVAIVLCVTSFIPAAEVPPFVWLTVIPTVFIEVALGKLLIKLEDYKD